MRIALALALCLAACQSQADIWINELHYDDDDQMTSFVFDFAEVAISPSSTSLNYADVALTFYGSDGNPYLTRTLDSLSLSPVYASGFQFASNAGDGDNLVDGLGGIALSISGLLVPGQFLSYGGTFTGASGVAAGVLSIDVGFAQSDSTEEIETIALIGQNGESYDDFEWAINFLTPTGPNIGQTFGPAAVPEASQLLLFGTLALIGGSAAAYRRWRS